MTRPSTVMASGFSRRTAPRGAAGVAERTGGLRYCASSLANHCLLWLTVRLIFGFVVQATANALRRRTIATIATGIGCADTGRGVDVLRSRGWAIAAGAAAARTARLVASRRSRPAASGRGGKVVSAVWPQSAQTDSCGGARATLGRSFPTRPSRGARPADHRSTARSSDPGRPARIAAVAAQQTRGRPAPAPLEMLARPHRGVAPSRRGRRGARAPGDGVRGRRLRVRARDVDRAGPLPGSCRWATATGRSAARSIRAAWPCRRRGHSPIGAAAPRRRARGARDAAGSRPRSSRRHLALSSGPSRVIAWPCRPMRPVRPMRWVSSSGDSGSSKLMTWSTWVTSSPRAATLVASRIGTAPERKSSITRSRAFCDRLPCSAATG